MVDCKDWRTCYNEGVGCNRCTRNAYTIPADSKDLYLYDDTQEVEEE